MMVHLPAEAGGGGASREASLAALVVFRGGGYRTCAGSGAGTAAWAATQGLVGIEVEYTCAFDGEGPGSPRRAPRPPKGGGSCESFANAQGEAAPLLRPFPDVPTSEAAYPAALEDGARAVRLVRHLGLTGELPVDPHRVAVCGFSAGGHLASVRFGV